MTTENTAAPDYKLLYDKLCGEYAAQKSQIESLKKDVQRSKKKEIPLFNSGYEYITNLQYRVRTLSARVSDFRSGEKYVRMQTEHKKRLAEKERENKKLKRELHEARRQIINVRKIWEQVFSDLNAEHSGVLMEKDRNIRGLDEKVLKTQIMLDAEKDKARELRTELYRVKTELEDEKGKVMKLTSQINRDHENSSVPSSGKPNRKKITNNRVVTGKRPGGQPGHKGHVRKKQIPTNHIEIPAPEKYTDSRDYRPTGRIISKQMIGIRMEITVNEYSTPEFRKLLTGQRVHAQFPAGVADDVNYDGSIRAFAFLLNNHCNVSVKKVSGFLSGLTGGKLVISAGMINGLSKEFSLKTGPEQRRAFADMLLAPVVNTDLTNARVNGKRVNVVVCATPESAIYSARHHKGHEGVKGTVVYEYQHTLVHDHDRTFYRYGSAHQECLEHVLRYLRDSMENEPNLKWNRKMRELIQEMIHFRKNLYEDDEPDSRHPNETDPDKVRRFEKGYDELLVLAKV